MSSTRNIYIYIYIYIYKFTKKCQTPDYLILGLAIARARKRFQHPLLTIQPANMTQSAQTTIPPNRHKELGLSATKIKCLSVWE